MSLPVDTLNRLYENAVKLLQRQDYEIAGTSIQEGLTHADDACDANGEPFMEKFRALQQQLQVLEGEPHSPEPSPSTTGDEQEPTSPAFDELEGEEADEDFLPPDQEAESPDEDSSLPDPNVESPEARFDQLLQQAGQTKDLSERLALLRKAQEVEDASADSIHRALELYKFAERERLQAESAARLIEYQQAEDAGDWQQAMDIARQAQGLDGDWDTLLRTVQKNLARLEDLRARWQALSHQASTPSIATLQAVIQSAQGLIAEAQALKQGDLSERWQAALDDWQEKLTQHQAQRDQLLTAAQKGDEQALAELARFDPDEAQSIQDKLSLTGDTLNQSRLLRTEAQRILSKEPYAVQSQLTEVLERLRALPSAPQITEEIEQINVLFQAAREAVARKSIAQTLGETLSEFDTPEALKAVNDPLLKEIERLHESGADEALAKANRDYYDSNLLAFKRVATARLRSHINVKVRPLHENSPFDFNGALKIYQEALKQWREFQQVYPAEDGNLKRRLAIVAQQTSDLSEAISVAQLFEQRWQALTEQAKWDAEVLVKLIQEELQPAFHALSPNMRYPLRFLVALFHLEWSKHVKQTALHLTQQIKRLGVDTEDKRGQGAGDEALALAKQALELAQTIVDLQGAFQDWQQDFTQAYQAEWVGEKSFIETYAVGNWHLAAPVAEAQRKVEQMQQEARGQALYVEAILRLQEGKLHTSESLLEQIPPHIFYATRAQSLFALIPNLKQWHQNAIEDENHRRYPEALTHYQKILTEFPDAKFAAERFKILQPLSRLWQDMQTWLKSAKAAIERDDFSNALALLKNIPDEFKQEPDVQETRQLAEGGHQEAERIKQIRANIRQLWQGSLSQEDYEQIGELLKGLPQSDNAYSAWYQRWQRATQVFEKVENREQSDSQLLDVLENLPATDQESEYAQKLITQIKARITERQDSAGIQQQLEQALNDERFADALYIIKKIIDNPKKYTKLQEEAKTKRALAEQKLCQQITDIFALPPAQRDAQLNFVRAAYKAQVDVLGQTAPGLMELGEAIQRVEKIAEITRLLNDTEADNSEVALIRIKDFRLQLGGDAELEELQARSELRRFGEIARQAYIASEMQKAVENFDKALSAYKRIAYPNDFERNLFKSLHETRGRAWQSAKFEVAREKWDAGDFTAAREALMQLPESDAEAQRYLEEGNKLEALTTEAHHTTLKESLPAWRKVLAQKPGLKFAEEARQGIRHNLLVKAQDLVKTFVDIPVEKLKPEDIHALVEASAYAQLILDDESTAQPEIQQVKNQASSVIHAWQRYLAEQKSRAEQEGKDWEVEQFERLADDFESAIQMGGFSEREKRTVTDLRLKGGQVRDLNKHLDQARQHYQKALATGSGDFQDALTAINNAAQEPFFGLRKATVELRKQILSAQTEVENLRNDYDAYERSQSAMERPQPLEPFDDLTLRQIYETTKEELETALEAVRAVRKADPENRYNLRERGWLKSEEPDPLVAIEAQLDLRQKTLESLKSGLEDVKNKAKRAETLKQATLEKTTQRTNVDEMRNEAKSWESLKTIFVELHDQLVGLLALPADIPAPRRFQARLKDIEGKSNLQTEIEHAAQQAQTLRAKADTCYDHLARAGEQYASQNWQSALTYYRLALSENPQDLQASRQVIDVEKKIRDIERIKRGRIFAVVAIILIFAVFGIGFVLACPNGVCLTALQPTPTPTPTRQLVTRVPSATLAPTHTPTMQPSTTPTFTPTVTLTATATPPRVYTQCRIDPGVRAFPKAEPGGSSNGNQILENTVIVFLDSVELENEQGDKVMWYYVAYPSDVMTPLGWIDLRVSPCSIISQP